MCCLFEFIARNNKEEILNELDIDIENKVSGLEIVMTGYEHIACMYEKKTLCKEDKRINNAVF